MKIFCFAVAFFITAASVCGAPLIPTKQGTTWQYNATDEAGGDSTPNQSQIRYRIDGTQQFAGKDLLKLETLVDNIVTNTEVVSVDQNGIRSFARTSSDGNMVGFISPQTIVPAKLRKGVSWECVDEIADVRVDQHFTIMSSEKVSVPAGDFRAFRLHSEESAPMSVTIDRWFVDGIGFVKEITTLRSPTGDLLHRRTLELANLPTAETKAKAATKKLAVGVSSAPIGNFEMEFPNTTQNLYARWVGHDLRQGAKVRAVWIAEDVGDIAPPNYKIDEAKTIAAAPDAHGMFTLSRPEDGWTPGKYRVEFYLDDILVDTVKIEIK